MYRLAPGHHVYRADSGWRYSTAESEIVRITVPDGLPGLLLEHLGSGSTAPGLDADVAEFAEALVHRGVLIPVEEPAAQVSTHGGDGDLGDVLLLGEGAIADRAAALLTGPRRITRLARPTEEALSRVSAVVSVAGWLPDARWVQEEELLAGAGVLWQRCYHEGRRVVIGPVAAGAAGPSYTDTRGRLLAAAPDPSEMLSLWQHLAAAPPPEEVDMTTGCVAAGLLVADLLLAARTRAVTATAAGAPTGGVQAGTQRVLDPDGWTLTAHPVLPLPRTDTPRG